MLRRRVGRIDLDIIDLTIRSDESVGFAAVAVAGELDLVTVPVLRRHLFELVDRQPRIVVDVSRLKLCDASSLTALVQLDATCRRNGGWLRLAGPTGIVAKVLGIVAFDQAVGIYATVAGAGRGDAGQLVKPG
jgi:anti-anti-sigma factor